MKSEINERPVAGEARKVISALEANMERPSLGFLFDALLDKEKLDAVGFDYKSDAVKCAFDCVKTAVSRRAHEQLTGLAKELAERYP